MSATVTKATAQIHAAEDDSPHGSFEAIISTPALDRDGDRLAPDGWKTPLPEHIPVSVDHKMTADSIVGSGRPYLDRDGSLRIRGTFASTDLGQTVRSLVNSGHLRTLSVEFLEQRGAKSAAPQRELVGCSLVYLPSNREATVLSSKAAQAVEDFAAGSGSDEDEEPTEPVNSLDPTELSDFVNAVAELPATADEDLPDLLADLTTALADLAAPFLAGPEADPADPSTEGKSASVSAKVKAMLAALE